MIASLLSGDNRWINGQRIEVSGGMALQSNWQSRGASRLLDAGGPETGDQIGRKVESCFDEQS
jgi:hypothetical protein